MPLTFDQQISIKRLLMKELTSLGAGNLVLFKLIGKVDSCDDLNSLLDTVKKAVTLLIDENAAAGLAEKINNSLKS